MNRLRALGKSLLGDHTHVNLGFQKEKAAAHCEGNPGRYSVEDEQKSDLMSLSGAMCVTFFAKERCLIGAGGISADTCIVIGSRKAKSS